MIEVVSGVIVVRDRLLLAQRPTDKDYPLMWETPGGKVEGNESHHGALRRELKEELGIFVGGIAPQPIWCGEVKRGGRDSVFLLYYFVTDYTGTPTPLEGQGIGLFDHGALPHLEMAPGNLAAFDAISGTVKLMITGSLNQTVVKP